MIEKYGDFWIHLDENKYDAIVCTINGVVKKDGCLVMGAGIAKGFAEEYPWLPEEWGNRIHKEGLHVIATPYNRIDLSTYHLIGLPTKYHWKDEYSDIGLIDEGMRDLRLVADVMGWKKILMPRPGCKNGKLDWNVVKQRLFHHFADDRITVINNGQ